MILEKLNENEVELYGMMRDPKIMSEILFPSEVKNHTNLSNYREDDSFKIRLHQIPYLSYEYLLAKDKTLSDIENFKNKKGSGNAYVYCGRGTGKSLISQLIDLLLDTIMNYSDWTVIFSSFDQDHVENVLEPYIEVMRRHSFFKLFNATSKRKPHRIATSTGHHVKGVNMNLSGREPGSAFESIHAQKIYIDEHQYEIDEVVKKRSQSIGEEGSIERFAGICSFRKASPAGEIFYSLSKRPWLINQPKTISPSWDEHAKRKAIDDYSGSSSLGFKMHILAEVVQDAEGLYDIERIRQCMEHNSRRPIKRFEIDKLNYELFKKLIVVERPEAAKKVFICSDFGSTAPSEIIIIFEVDAGIEGVSYQYRYNITLRNLVPDEQFEIFKWLGHKLEANLIALDSTEWGGKQIVQDLKEEFPPENIIGVHFSEKCIVDYEKDENGITLTDKKGAMIPIEAFVIDWAVEQVKKIFYNKKIDCFYDLKLDTQFNAMICARMSSRMKYGCKVAEDHLHASFLVFAYARWLKEGADLNNINKSDYFKGFVF